MNGRHAIDDVGVVLTYKDFYGTAAQLDNLIDTLQQFAIDDWICQLARLSILLAGQKSRNPKWTDAFLRYFTPPDMIDKVNAWFQHSKEKGRVATVPSEREIGILIELVILHSPTKAQRQMDFPQDSKVVFDAILMVADLAQPKVEGLSKEELISVFASLWLRSICPYPLSLIEYGYHLFDILSPNRSPKALEWAALFEQATGENLDDYFAGGFATIVMPLNQSPEDIAGCWTSVLNPKQLTKFPKFQKAVKTYYEVKAGSLSSLKRDILKYEVAQDDLGSFNLIAIKNTPLIKYKSSVYPLYLHGIASSLLDGVYHAVISQDPENEKHRKKVGGVFGNLHEKAVLDVLESGFPGRLLRNPVRKDNRQEAADAILLCECGLVVFQIKGCHIPAQMKFCLQTPKTLRELFKRIGLIYAAEQLKVSLDACRNNLVEGIPVHWTKPEMPIHPVIITFERIPEFSLFKPEIDAVVATAKIDRFVRPTILLCPEDVTRIINLEGSKTIWSLLEEYSSSGGSRRPFHNFLSEAKIGTSQFYKERRNQMVDRVAEYLGYDINEVVN